MANEQEVAAPTTEVIETKPDAKEEASSTSDSTTTQPEGAAKPLVEEKTPFHKDPEVKSYLEKMMSRREREWEKRIRGVEDMYRGKLENLVNLTQPKVAGQQALPPEQRQALLELVRLIKSDPDAAKELGLGSSEELRQQIEKIEYGKAQENFDGEVSSVIGTYSERYGLDKTEFEEELREFIQTNEFFNNSHYSKGMVEIAAMTMLKDRQAELSERAANLKLIKEQKEKKGQATERSSVTSQTPSKKMPKTLQDFLSQRVAESGGLIVD